LSHSHSSSVRSLGYVFSFIFSFYTTHEDFSDRLLEALRFKYGTEVYEEPSRDTTKYNDATVLKTDVSALDKALGAYWDRLAATLVEGGKVQ
jgi:hypothetical protein